jgi:hypothetical protein
VVRLAATICDTPIAVINFIDAAHARRTLARAHSRGEMDR